MCQRYSLSTPTRLLKERFGVQVPDEHQATYNAAPTASLPVITNQRPEEFSYFYWGTDPMLANGKSVSKRWINQPAINLTKRKSGQQALRARRCLIPATGFYNWRKVSRKGEVPYYFCRPDGQPFAMAGIWEGYDDYSRNLTIHRFTILTTSANNSIESIQAQMPLILSRTQEKKWLEEQEPSQLYSLLNYSQTALNYYPVSTQVNDLSADHPGLIEHVKPADQFGNYSLFDFQEVKLKKKR